MVALTLRPKPIQLRSFASPLMRVSDSGLQAVVFLGYPGHGEAFHPVGTAFFVHHKRRRYLVTAQHIAAQLGDDPFGIRVNKFDGTTDILMLDLLNDTARWFSNVDDPDEDLAVLPFSIDLVGRGYDCREISSDSFAVASARQEWDIGIGDACYAIGLFRLMAGTRRNLPVVHTGSIALVPGDERIPVRDCLAPPERPSYRHVEGYLVEMQNLKGLSGSPVLVRSSFVTVQRSKVGNAEPRPLYARVQNEGLLLLGMWQGSWDAPPDEVMAIERCAQVRIPAGMGTVVPADRIMALLDSPALDEFRREQDARGAANNAVTPDGSAAP